MTYTTNIEFTPEMLATARKIGETMIAIRKRTATPDDLRTVMAESRDRWGDNLHEVIKARGLMGATGGRA